MKKIVMSIIFGLLILAGCGNSSDSNSNELTVWIPGDDAEYWYYYDLVKAFNESQSDYTVVVEEQPWSDYWTKLPLEVNNGRGPDIFLTHTAYKDVLLPISQPYAKSVEELSSSFQTTDTFVDENGYPYYIPTTYTPTLLYVNTDMWEAAGLTKEDYPTTWEELETVATKLKDDANKVIGFNYSFHILWDLMYQNGETLTNADGTANFSKEIIQKMVDANGKYTDYITFGSGDVESSFLNGASAMIYGQPWMQNYFEQTQPELNFEAIALPSNGSDIVNHTFAELSFGINKNLKDDKLTAANAFIDYMLLDQTSISNISKGNNGASNNIETLANQSFEDGTAGAISSEYIKNEQSVFIYVPAELEEAYKILLSEVMSGTSIDDAIAKAQKAAENVDLTDLTKLEDEIRKD